MLCPIPVFYLIQFPFLYLFSWSFIADRKLAELNEHSLVSSDRSYELLENNIHVEARMSKLTQSMCLFK